MPYITEEYAAALEGTSPTSSPGALNYGLSLLMANYIEDNGLSYQSINDISGAMTEALAEFRRRIVVPYEQAKMRSGVDPYGKIRPNATETDDEWIARINAG